MAKEPFMQKLKRRWGVQSTWGVISIFIVFSLAGMAIARCRHPIFHLLHFTSSTPFWVKLVTWLLLLFPLYQFFLLVFGALFGRFGFFWAKEKKMFGWLARKLIPSRSSTQA